MISVDVSSNIAEVRARFAKQAEQINDRAIARALNRAGDQATTEASRRIRESYAIKAGDLKKYIKNRRRASGAFLQFETRFASARLPLILFGASKTARGVTVRVKIGGKRGLIQHAFIAKLRSGHTGVFARTAGKGLNPPFRFGPGSGQKGRRWGAPDLPITQLHTLDVSTMFKNKAVLAAVQKKALDSFENEFERQIRLLSR